MESKKYCEHCNSNLSLKTWKTHRRLYYDDAADTWVKKVCRPTEEDFEDSDEDLTFDFETGSQAMDDPDIPPVVGFDLDADNYFDAVEESPPVCGELFFLCSSISINPWSIICYRYYFLRTQFRYSR